MFWLRFHLKVAYSTEIGAWTAYQGHAAATREPEVKADIERIAADEKHHREAVGEMLDRFDAKPWWWLELLFTFIGTCVGAGCHIWGGWASAFGAAQFEFGGAGDYKRAAKAARAVGEPELAEQLELYQEQETEHRRYFLALARWYLGRRRTDRPLLQDIS